MATRMSSAGTVAAGIHPLVRGTSCRIGSSITGPVKPSGITILRAALGQAGAMNATVPSSRVTSRNSLGSRPLPWPTYAGPPGPTHQYDSREASMAFMASTPRSSEVAMTWSGRSNFSGATICLTFAPGAGSPERPSTTSSWTGRVPWNGVQPAGRSTADITRSPLIPIAWAGHCGMEALLSEMDAPYPSA